MRASILWRRWLRVGLAAGGLLDLALAASLAIRLAAPADPIPPSTAFYLRLGTVLVAAVGLASLLAANEPRRYSPLVWIIATERLAAGAVLAAGPTSALGPQRLALLAGIELGLGLSLLLAQWRLRR